MWREAAAYADYCGEGEFDDPEVHEPYEGEQPLRRRRAALPDGVIEDEPEEECPF